MISIHKISLFFLAFNLAALSAEILFYKKTPELPILEALVTAIVGCIVYNKKLLFVQVLATNILLYNLISSVRPANLYMMILYKLTLDLIYWYTAGVIFTKTLAVYIMERHPNLADIILSIFRSDTRNIKIEFMGFVVTSIGKIKLSETRLDECTKTETGLADCSICLVESLQPEKLRILACNHKFHILCIDSWLLNAGHTSCPICRFDITLQVI
jgi:hypothetical protein